MYIIKKIVAGEICKVDDGIDYHPRQTVWAVLNNNAKIVTVGTSILVYKTKKVAQCEADYLNTGAEYILNPI